MLEVAAGQFRDPVVFFVEMEAGDWAVSWAARRPSA
jgi:hypothetical protein